MPKLSDTYLRGLKVSQRQDFKDDIVPGLWIRVGAGDKGSKVWVFRYRKGGAQKSVTLGSFPAMGLKDARIAAEAVRDGNNAPAKGSPSSAAKTFAEVAEDFIASHDFQRNKTAEERARSIRTGIVPLVGTVKIADFSRKDAKRVIDRYMGEDKPSMARRVKVQMSQVLAYAVGEDMIAYNPMAGMKMPAPMESRDRFLSRQELRDFWAYLNTDAAKQDPMRRAIRWLVATGQRRSECLYLHASEIDQEQKRWTLPAERTKNGRAHTLPLTDWHLELLGEPSESGFYFTNPKRGGELYNERSLTHHVSDYCDMRNINSPFTAHDIRRTVTTNLAELNVSLEDLKRVLNHTIGGVTTKHYDMFAYLPQKLAVMEKWRDLLKSL